SGESLPSCGEHTTHSPFINIAGNKTTSASLWSINFTLVSLKLSPKLLLMCLYVIDRKSLQRWARETQIGSFRHRAIDVPLVHERSLDKPHGRSAIAASAVDKGRFGAGCLDCLQKLIHGFGGRIVSVKRNVH